MMGLRVLLPSRVLLNAEVTKVSAEGSAGCFTLLPHHVDLVTSLAPGILAYERLDAPEDFLAVDGGILVKQGPRVVVTVRRGVRGDSLQSLQETVRQRFLDLDEEERQARAVLSRLEASVLRGLLEGGDVP